VLPVSLPAPARVFSSVGIIHNRHQLSELVLSKFEGSLTNKIEVQWNTVLLKICVAWLIFVFFFFILAQIVIKVFFKSEQSHSRPRYKNIISFKHLFIIFCICSTLLLYSILIYFGILKFWKKNLLTPFPFILTLATNICLLFYFLTHALDYWIHRLQQIKETRNVKNEMELNTKKAKLFAPRNKNEMDIGSILRNDGGKIQHRDYSVYVIDLEDSDKLSDGSSTSC
jgi:hypothetical protein